MKQLRLIVYLLLLTTLVNAQKKSDSVDSPLKPGWLINTNLLSLMGYEGGPSVGVEYRIARHFAAGASVGGVFYDGVMSDRDESHKRGYKTQVEVKYFLLGENEYRHFYFSVMWMHKQVRYNEKISSDSANYVISRQKTIDAYSANAGMQYFFGRSHRGYIDVFAGLGGRNRVSDPPKLRPGPNNVVRAHYDFGQGYDGGNVHIALGFRLGYRF